MSINTTSNSSNWNVPNALTALRIVMVPVFVWLLWAGGTHGDASLSMRWWAVAVFILTMITDWLDGSIARSRNLITSFGKIADPIASLWTSMPPDLRHARAITVTSPDTSLETVPIRLHAARNKSALHTQHHLHLHPP